MEMSAGDAETGLLYIELNNTIIILYGNALSLNSNGALWFYKLNFKDIWSYFPLYIYG